MVGALLLMKLIHCKGSHQNHDTKIGSDTEIQFKIEHQEEICRVCLKEGTIPIFGEEDMSDDIFTCTGVDIQPDDEYPKKLCQSCLALLQGAILFKKTAQNSIKVLKQTDKRKLENGGDEEKNKHHCQSCDIDFKSLKHFNKHCNTEEHDMMTYQADEDNEDSVYGDDLNDCADDFVYEPIQKTKRKSDCKYCNVQFKTSKAFLKHCESEEHKLRKKSRKRSIDCNDQVTDGNYKNNDDFFEPLPKEKSEFYCKRCNLDFKTYKEYDEHRLSDDHENMRQRCNICQKTYSCLYFKKHMSLHTKETPYMCDICGKNFIVQGQFSRHRLTHFYNLPFKCSLCPYRGRFTESLKMHMRSHTGEKPYQCSQCPSRFINKSNLNKHMLTHKGEHDFKCETCGRGFYTKRDLELHFKVDHTGIKDHVCNICGKAFGYRKQMMKHQLKVHKREKLRSGRMPLYLQVDTGKVAISEE